MTDTPPFNIRSEHRSGISRAAEWHDRMSKIFRTAIDERRPHGITYGEHLLRAEWHEGAAKEMRRLVQPTQGV